MASYDDTATVSGSVVSIDNGADEVGAKSCVVTVRPTLSGVSSVTETQTGRNLLNGEDAVITTNNIRFYFSNGKYYSAGTYTLSISENVSGLYVRNVSTGTNVSVKYNSDFITFTLTEKTLIGFDFYKVGINQDDTIQLEYGSTTHAYEPYQTPTVYTASLGRTIYGGEVDIVNGTGTVGYALFTKNTADMNNSESYPGWKDQGVRAICGGGINQEYEDGVTSAGNGYGINTLGNSNDILYLPKSMHNNMTQTEWIAQAIDITFVIPLATPEDYTFDGQEVPTRLGYNAFWSEQGDSEVTYYKDGYGFTSVTVNKTGKNLFDISKVATTGTTAGISWSVSGNEITISGTATSSGWKTFVEFKLPHKGTYHFHMNATGNVGYFLRGWTQLVGKDVTEVCNDTSQVYRIAIAVTTTGQTYEGTISEIQIEVGDAYTSYEPYEAISKTAYLHKVIYGGTADVVKGTCEPKNLLDDSKRVFTEKNIIFGRDSGGRDDFCLKLKAGTYTFSVATADGTYTNLYLKNSDTKESISGFPAYATSSKSFTLTEDTNCAVFVYKSDYTSVSDITSAQIEKGSSASEYVPHFDPFSFPPISMETDEGENTLFANEGASAITYRKAVD